MTRATTNAALRVVVVDDEPLAREGIRVRLERAGGVAVVGECGDGAAAVELIRRLRPDVAFLDFQMPCGTGIDVVREVGQDSCPYYVFVTAFDSEAIRAFELNALDYLVKPIANARLLNALERARRAVATRDLAMRGQKLDDLLAAVGVASDGGVAARATKMNVRIGNRIVLIAPAEIDWVEAAGDYVNLHVAAKSWPLRESLSGLAAKLAPFGFTRIHRSSLVNAERVVELRALDDGEYTVVLKDGTALKLSRNYRNALPALLRSAG